MVLIIIVTKNPDFCSLDPLIVLAKDVNRVGRTS